MVDSNNQAHWTVSKRQSDPQPHHLMLFQSLPICRLSFAAASVSASPKLQRFFFILYYYCYEYFNIKIETRTKPMKPQFWYKKWKLNCLQYFRIIKVNRGVRSGFHSRLFERHIGYTLYRFLLVFNMFQRTYVELWGNLGDHESVWRLGNWKYIHQIANSHLKVIP